MKNRDTEDKGVMTIYPVGCTELPKVSERFRTIVGHITAADLARLPLRNEPGVIGNLREKKVRSAARKGIQASVKETPDLFPAKNGGIQIVCRGATENADGSLVLESPALVDGAQTQATLLDMNAEVLIFFRALVIRDQNDPAWRTITVSHNVRSAPAKLSIFGKLGYFSPLEDIMGCAVRVSETDAKMSPDRLDTEELIAHTFAYLGVPGSSGAKGLNRYEAWLHDTTPKGRERFLDFLAHAPLAHMLAEHCRVSSGFDSFRSYVPKGAGVSFGDGRDRIRMITAPALFVYGGCGGKLPAHDKPSWDLDRAVQKFLLAEAKQNWDFVRRLSTMSSHAMDRLADYMTAREAG